MGEVGVPFIHARMGVRVRHREGRKDNVLKTQIYFLTLVLVGAPGIQAGRGHVTGYMGQKTRRTRQIKDDAFHKLGYKEMESNHSMATVFKKSD